MWQFSKTLRAQEIAYSSTANAPPWKERVNRQLNQFT
jgi:hypothetical protein